MMCGSKSQVVEGFVLAKSRILVSVSSPWASEMHTTAIVNLASRLDAEVVIAHVAQLQEEDETEDDAKARGEQTLQLMTDALHNGGIEAEGVLLFSDDIAKALLNTARARQCSLIVLGLTGKSMLKRLIAGDIPSNIVRQTDIPVLLFPPNCTTMI